MSVSVDIICLGMSIREQNIDLPQLLSSDVLIRVWDMNPVILLIAYNEDVLLDKCYLNTVQ